MNDFLDAIRMLDESPPVFRPVARRQQAFRQIEKFLSEHTARGRACDLARPDCPIWPPVASRLALAAAQARDTQLSRGEVHLWQMYNHGVLIKDDEITIGLDMVVMPRKFGWPEDRNLRDLLARTVDLLMITHGHPDHFDHALVQSCLRLGRPVLLPQPLAVELGYDPNLYAMGDGTLVELYDMKIRSWRGYHVWQDSLNAVPLIVYDVTGPSGYRFIFGGDLDYTKPFGRGKIKKGADLMFVPWRSPNALYEPENPGALGRPHDAVRLLVQNLKPKALLFEHYAELEHIYDGLPPSYELALSLQADLPIPSDVLFWGEAVRLAPRACEV